MGNRDQSIDQNDLLPGRLRSSPEAETEAAALCFSDISDYELREKIQRSYDNITAGIFDKLPDKGQKYRWIHSQCLNGLELRNIARIQKDVPECQTDTQTESTESPDQLGINANIASMESNAQGKLEDKTDAAFSEELGFVGREKYRSLSEIGFQLQAECQPPQKSQKHARNTSRELPLKKNKHRFSNYKLSDVGRRSISSSQTGKSLSRRFLQKRRAANRRSTNWEFEEVQHVVLVDDEDAHPIKSIHCGDTTDDRDDYKIYYPSRDDPECVEISYSNLKCLDPESYLSSPIMNFYIQYLQRSPSLIAKRKGDCYIFNTYFYSKLEEAMTCKYDGIAPFLKLRRWWKGVNIFQKAYIFLPIYGDMHWSLAIICIPAKEDESGLLILHLDSLGLHGSSHIFTIVCSYLKEEWFYIIQNDLPQELPISEKLWKHLPYRIKKEKIMVPQQKNEYDCGLFVLYFMQRFIEQAPDRLRKKDLMMFGRKWFQPEEASGLRTKIKALAIEEFENNMLKHGVS